VKSIAFLISLFITALGAQGIISPLKLLSFARKFESRAGLYAAAALRLAMGTSIFHSAIASRIPNILRAIGATTFVTGLITPFIGVQRFARILSWWSARGPAFMRAWAALALGIGIFLAWAVIPWRENGARKGQTKP